MWTAIVPFRQGSRGKTRLSSRLSPEERETLGRRLCDHVLDCLDASSSVDRIMVLSPAPVGKVSWLRDKVSSLRVSGGGLNTELAVARAALDAPVVVVHADLPMLTPDDIDAMTDAARGGCALAPDRHCEGSNALAVTPAWQGGFSFGPGSFARHSSAGAGADIATVVKRHGLMLDIDTPDDLDEALRLGWSPW